MNDVAVPLASVLAFCRLNVRFVLLQRPAVLRPNGPIYQAIDATTLQARNIETWPFFNQVIWLGLCIASVLLQCSIFGVFTSCCFDCGWFWAFAGPGNSYPNLRQLCCSEV